MDGISLLAAAVGLLTLLGVWEATAHRRRLARIPVRVHVNGTRGKSSVTRLVAAGLRAGGHRVVAKTTGTLPRLILPDGREEPIHRRGRANVIEQVGIVRRAVAERAEVLVLECMALQPTLQSLCELDLVRSTHGVVTNARPDHLDVMGPTPRDVAKALAGTTPRNARLYTAERKLIDVFVDACRDRKSILAPTTAFDVACVTDDDLRGFSYLEHADNVALALRVCDDVGVDRRTALAGMWAATPDPGALTVDHLVHGLGRSVFVNGFAANDPESTAGNWNVVRDRFPETTRGVAVVNCREDRSDRTEQLAEMCATLEGLDSIVLVGTGTALFTRRYEQLRSERTRSPRAEHVSRAEFGSQEDCGTRARGTKNTEHVVIHDMSNRSVADVAEAAVRFGGSAGRIVGMGNVAGPGLELVRWFEERAGHPETSPWQEAA